MTPTSQLRWERIKDNAMLLFGCVLAMWALEIVDHLLAHKLDWFGVKPRTSAGLIGIVTAPWLHFGFPHLIGNTIPFLVLGGLVLLGGRRVFVSITIFISLLGGLGVWLFGPAGSNHAGASIFIFGYLGFLLSRGFFEKSVFWVLVSFVILVLYGWMILGIFPSQPGVSWQGHLFGFIAGIVGAWGMFPGEKNFYGG